MEGEEERKTGELGSESNEDSKRAQKGVPCAHLRGPSTSEQNL